MQTPGVLDLNCYQGANFDYTLTWQSGGSAVNLTGYTARMQVRESYDASGSALVSITSGTGITLGGTAGTIALALTATQTAALDGTPNIQAIYDLELVSGAGYVTRLVEGRFYIYPEVTR
jgi:hypothetical protein